MTLFFALLGWRTFAAERAFVRRLHPFVVSMHLVEEVIAADSSSAAQDPVPPLARSAPTCCRRTTARWWRPARWPRWSPPARYPAHAPVTPLLPRFDAAGPELLPLVSGADAAWALRLDGRQGQIGVLLLGRRRGDGLYTEEEIAIARAVDERLLDLTRAQWAESQVADRQVRRVLHDEILPDLHAALILLDQGDGVATAEAGQLLATVPPRRQPNASTRSAPK